MKIHEAQQSDVHRAQQHELRPCASFHGMHVDPTGAHDSPQMRVSWASYTEPQMRADDAGAMGRVKSS